MRQRIELAIKTSAQFVMSELLIRLTPYDVKYVMYGIA